jgi:hypothetical protein
MIRTGIILCLISLTLGVVSCGDDDNPPTMNLPTGCTSQGVYAISILEHGIACLPTNAFADSSQIIGAPNFIVTGPGKTEFQGFTSLGVQGNVVAFMGSCIQDLPGADLRVFQAVSEEPVEVLVSASNTGPFISLGTQNCRDQCDFDLAGSGLNNIRVVQVRDAETNFVCDQVGMSPGADIDAVQVLHPGS